MTMRAMGFIGWKKTRMSLAKDSIDWNKHDEQFHGGHFDPGTMKCSLRDKEERKDEADELCNGRVLGQIPSPKAQYDAVVALFTNPDGSRKQGWMKAPNGNPTKLTERQWVQVRTPSFKKWFGDWENDKEHSSKVVDINGEPLVVYHGQSTEGGRFEEFDMKGHQGNIWFGVDKDYAFGYADGRRPTYEVFIRSLKPLDLSRYNQETYIYETNDDGSQVTEDKVARDIAEQSGASLSDVMRLSDETNSVDIMEFTDKKRVVDFFSNIGFDAFKCEEVGTITYGAFHPNQIKSATDNDGWFSTETDNILR